MTQSSLLLQQLLSLWGMLRLRQGSGQSGKRIWERKFHLVRTQREDTSEPGSSCHQTPNLLVPWSWIASEHPRSALSLLSEPHFHPFSSHMHSAKHWGSNPAHWALGWGRGHKTKQDIDSPFKELPALHSFCSNLVIVLPECPSGMFFKTFSILQRLSKWTSNTVFFYEAFPEAVIISLSLLSTPRLFTILWPFCFVLKKIAEFIFPFILQIPWDKVYI